MPPSSIAAQLRNRSKLMHRKELANILGKHPQTLKQWYLDGKIPYVRVNREAMFDPFQIADWLESSHFPVSEPVVKG